MCVATVYTTAISELTPLSYYIICTSELCYPFRTFCTLSQISAPAAKPAPTAVITAPTPSTSAPTTSTSAIPFLSNPAILLEFGRLDSDHHSHEITINPGQWNVALTDLWVTLQSACRPMAAHGCQQADFLRMTRTLLLKRVQDVMEEQNFQRPENYVRLSRSIQLPAPVGDSLSVIGTFTSSIIGVRYTLTIPDRPAQNPPTWWTVDGQTVRRYQSLCDELEGRYVVRGFPRQSDYQGLLVMVYPQLNGQYGRIKAYTNEPKLSDGFLRLINDDAVFENMPFAFEGCHLNMNNGNSVPAIRRQYYAPTL